MLQSRAVKTPRTEAEERQREALYQAAVRQLMNDKMLAESLRLADDLMQSFAAPVLWCEPKQVTH